jgi:hypothetical protein
LTDACAIEATAKNRCWKQEREPIPLFVCDAQKFDFLKKSDFLNPLFGQKLHVFLFIVHYFLKSGIG